MSSDKSAGGSSRGPSFVSLAGLMLLFAVVTFGLVALLTNIFEKKQESRVPFVRVVEVDEATTDPAKWGINWPDQYDTYLLTVDSEESEYGGSEALTASKLEAQPWLKRLYAGYAFSLDYREARGHAYMLSDQEVTKRVTERKQAGACLHCHASIVPTYRRLGLMEDGKTEVTADDLAQDFNWPAVMTGFKAMGAMEYADAHAELMKTPDGSGSEGKAHPVSCVDCHDPESMAIRVTRPGFVQGIAALAKSDDPVVHLPSITRWRGGNRERDYDPNLDASRQEMRTFVCAQCHVEYYCASKETLFFPWANGLKVEDIEELYDEHKFPDGSDFVDYKHGETGAKIYKAQHPEFELWSQGIHARSGVSCADCHMPYERKGATKISSHNVQSPMLNVNRACQTCHNVNEGELKQRVEIIQARTKELMERSAAAMTSMLDAINAAKAAGATDEQLAPIWELQKKGMWRLDFISSENSKGFHADQEAARILGEAIDYCRQAEVEAIKLRASDSPEVEVEAVEVEGITPDDKAPIR